jgi:hypothetical protein
MSGDKTKSPSAKTRGPLSRRALLLCASVFVVIVAVVVVVVVLTTGDDKENGAALGDESTATLVTSPYDMIELPGDMPLDVVAKASFISILVPDAKGSLTSYSVKSDLPPAQALISAVTSAKEVDEQLAAAVTATTIPLTAGGSSTATATITFVFASRETLTFALDLGQGLIARESQAWKPEGDLRALVEAAIKAPQ